RTTKFFNIAHGIYIPIGAYMLYVLVEQLSLNLSLGILLSVLFCGLVGWSLDKLVFLPLRRKKASGLILMVASVGIYVATQALVAILFTSQFRTIDLAALRSGLTIAGAHITYVQLSALAAAVLILVALLLLNKTRFGRAARAISDNPDLARISGINIERVNGQLFFIGSAIAGLVGVVVGLDTGLEPTMGFSLMLKGIIATVLGGSASFVGSLLGGLALGQLESIATWFVAGIWKDAIAFVVLIGYLVLRPLRGGGQGGGR
ncbi:MAG: branched-chain amino acid ABC transporter permease, partial [bacterium]|nr:branched-chain amino acid ABC transporter permease [bacterium]